MKSYSCKRTAAPVALALSIGAIMMGGSKMASAAAPTHDVVQYGDLNTTTPDGIRVLSDRIENVAWQFCQDAAPALAAPSNLDNLRCQQAVIAEAVAKINNPMLTQMHPLLNTEDDLHNG